MKADITAKLEKYQADFSAWAETPADQLAYGTSDVKTFHEYRALMVEVAKGVERLYTEADAAKRRRAVRSARGC